MQFDITSASIWRDLKCSFHHKYSDCFYLQCGARHWTCGAPMLTLKDNCMMVIAKSKKQMTNTIKGMDYNWTPAPESPNNQDVSVPRAVFIPHSNSLPFDERRVTLEQPVKVTFWISFHVKVIKRLLKSLENSTKYSMVIILKMISLSVVSCSIITI